MALRIWDRIFPKVTTTVPKFGFRDNGGRRSGIERREYSYTAHIPERRSGTDRRSGDERRSVLSVWDGIECRLNLWRGLARRNGKERRRAWRFLAE